MGVMQADYEPERASNRIPVTGRGLDHDASPRNRNMNDRPFMCNSWIIASGVVPTTSSLRPRSLLASGRDLCIQKICISASIAQKNGRMQETYTREKAGSPSP